MWDKHFGWKTSNSNDQDRATTYRRIRNRSIITQGLTHRSKTGLKAAEVPQEVYN